MQKGGTCQSERQQCAGQEIQKERAGGLEAFRLLAAASEAFGIFPEEEAGDYAWPVTTVEDVDNGNRAKAGSGGKAPGVEKHQAPHCPVPLVTMS
jgi:hypothetical protein